MDMSFPLNLNKTGGGSSRSMVHAAAQLASEPLSAVRAGKTPMGLMA